MSRFDLIVLLALAGSFASCDTVTEPERESLRESLSDFQWSGLPFAGLMVVGDTAHLRLTAKNSQGQVVTVQASWMSSSPAIASIDQNGVLVAHKPGRTMISGEVPGRKYSAEITVTRPVAKIDVIPRNFTLLPGATTRLLAVAKDSADIPIEELEWHVFQWTSSDTSVAGVSGASVTGKSLGTATIAATVAGVVGTAVVEVGFVDLVSVDAGHSGACGLSVDGIAYCWGIPPSFDSVEVGPREPVSAPLPFVALTAGADHACGIQNDGTVMCWGGNRSGQLGDGSTRPANHGPVLVGGGMIRLVSISTSLLYNPLVGSGHTCGLDDSGAAYCWGLNIDRALGADTDEECSTGMYTLPVACSRWPVAVADAPALTLIAAGGAHTCGLDANAFAYCWGANHFGQLGTGSRSEQPLRPTPAAQGYVFQSLTAGGNHTCGLTTEGRIVCWGQNHEGQLGNGSGGLYQWSTPVAVAVDVTFRAVSAGTEHTCGLSVDGLAYCWGANASGQLGDGSRERRLVPTPTAGSVTFATVSAGGKYTCGLATDGLVYCWGYGAGATPVPVARQR